jgi:hypothetical protein
MAGWPRFAPVLWALTWGKKYSLRPRAPSLRVLCARVGFHELVFLFLLFNDPDVAESGFQFGDLVVMYAIERR